MKQWKQKQSSEIANPAKGTAAKYGTVHHINSPKCNIVFSLLLSFSWQVKEGSYIRLLNSYNNMNGKLFKMEQNVQFFALHELCVFQKKNEGVTL